MSHTKCIMKQNVSKTGAKWIQAASIGLASNLQSLNHINYIKMNKYKHIKTIKSTRNRQWQSYANEFAPFAYLNRYWGDIKISNIVCKLFWSSSFQWINGIFDE